MARFSAALERVNSSSLEQDENKVNFLKRFGGKAAKVSGVVVTAAAVGMATANADVVVGAGGMYDQSGRGYEQSLRNTGQMGPNDRYVPVEYPASIWPLGPETLQQSIDKGLPNYHAAMDHAQRIAAPGERIRSQGYSEGGILIAEGARQRFGESVVPGTVIIDGSPVTEAGMFNPQDPLVRAVLPLATNLMGVPTHYRAPKGSIVRGSEQDVWFNGGPSDLGKLFSQGVDTFFGPAHAVQHPDGAHYVVVGEDGITRVVFYGVGTGGIAPGGPTMGGPVVPGEVAPAPVRNEDHPRWVPNAENFEAKRRPVVEAPVTNRATNSVAAPVQRQNLSQPNQTKVERTERSVTKVDKKTGKKARVNSHVSIKATPGKVGRK